MGKKKQQAMLWKLLFQKSRPNHRNISAIPYESMEWIWRDRVGIEPTGDVTRLPEGFEDLEGHQYPIRPHR